MTFSEARFRPSLEERLESIISGAALMADSSCTRDDRRERIVAECNAVRQALQDLLSEYMNNVSPRLSGPRRPLWKILVRDQVVPGQEMPWESRSGEIQEPLWESSVLISQNALAEGTRLVEQVSEEYFGDLLEWFLGRFSGLPLIEESFLLVKVDGGWK